MRRLSPGLTLLGLFALPALVEAAPPGLPPTEAAPAETEPTPAPTATESGAPADTGLEEPAPPSRFESEGDVGGGGEVSLGAAGVDSEVAPGAEASAEEAVPAADPKLTGPGMVRGRKEPMMLTNRGSIGLFNTVLPTVGGRYTFRFRLHSDFFRKKNFFCCSSGDQGDEHGRVRGGVGMSFTPAKFMELYFDVYSQANRNARAQADRQDPPTVFALGDLDFGAKFAHGFKDGGVGLGGVLGMGLVSGSDRLLVNRVNFNVDLLFDVDLRYLTKKHAPVRFATNVGWMLDNSIRLYNWGSFSDDLSREVFRFSSGANHSRMRTRYAMDFPMRVGKEKGIGIDPFVEYSWDFSTHQEDAFLPLTEAASSQAKLKRSMAWLTIGLRANVYDGLFLDAGVNVGTSSPNYEFGPPVPPWQVVLGIGWSFDPVPVVKEVAATAPPPAPVVLEGRILGRVLDSAGTPVAGAKVSFPGLASNALLTDAAGTFTSWRFPDGSVTVSVELADASTVEQVVELKGGVDAQVDIALTGAAPEAAVAVSIVDGTFTDDAGNPVKVSMHVRGNGIDEPFLANDAGRIAVELPMGTYEAVLSSAGFDDKRITIVVETPETKVTEKLSKNLPVETPNVKGTATAIRLKKSIRYDGDGIDPASHPILDELAAYIKAHAEVQSVDIRVHTDDRGNPTSRSQGRADAVRDYLIAKGIDPMRLVAKGMGDKKPLAVNLTPDGRRKNNRTELKVTSAAAAAPTGDK